MLVIPRLLAFLALMFSGFTLIRPRTGWGRLALFIPKLFSGSFIFLFGFLGTLATLLGWLISRDALSVVLGICASTITSRYIYRIIRRSLNVKRSIEENGVLQHSNATKTMLSYPWVSLWKHPSDTLCQKDIQIGKHFETDKPILADLWRPLYRTNHSSLGLIYLHGSGWHYADKDFGTRRFFRHLTDQGHVIADVAYTLAPATDLFGMVADVKRAIAWMKSNARDLGVDSEGIILIGGSAGGHLALLVGYTPNHPAFDPPDIASDTSVHGVISYYGPPDLSAQFDRFNELPGLTGRTRVERMFMTYLEVRFGFEVLPVHRLLPALLGGDPSAVPALYELGSPSSHIGKHCPPTLLLQGAHDFSGVAPEVRKLYTTLTDAGCPAYLLELPDTEHGFDLYKPKWSPAAQAATYITERFLASLI